MKIILAAIIALGSFSTTIGSELQLRGTDHGRKLGSICYVSPENGQNDKGECKFYGNRQDFTASTHAWNKKACKDHCDRVNNLSAPGYIGCKSIEWNKRTKECFAYPVSAGGINEYKHLPDQIFCWNRITC